MTLLEIIENVLKGWEKNIGREIFLNKYIYVYSFGMIRGINGNHLVS